jgi:hypothetical protein
MHGARGFWAMATLGLAVAGVGLTAFLTMKLRRDARTAVAASQALA